MGNDQHSHRPTAGYGAELMAHGGEDRCKQLVPESEGRLNTTDWTENRTRGQKGKLLSSTAASKCCDGAHDHITLF